jgi:hypothetical protein
MYHVWRREIFRKFQSKNLTHRKLGTGDAWARQNIFIECPVSMVATSNRALKGTLGAALPIGSILTLYMQLNS